MADAALTDPASAGANAKKAEYWDAYADATKAESTASWTWAGT
jgi:hypothetical protein